MTFTIHVENIFIILLMGLLGMLAFILLIRQVVKSEKTFNPFTIFSKFFKLIFKTEVKTDTGRINLFFGLCSFVYILIISLKNNPIADLVPNNNPITSEVLYFMIVAVIILVCVYIVSQHDSIVSKDNVRIDKDDVKK